MWKYVLGVFLALHGLIHLEYLVPAPHADPKYPFDLSRSWLVDSFGLDISAARLFGVVLSGITIVGFIGAVFAFTGIAIPEQWGLLITALSVVASLLLLLMFWNSWLSIGVGIDIWLIVAVVHFGWQPFMR